MECKFCNGNGWTAEHANHPHPDGDCLGECPVQSGCEYCNGSGKLTDEELDKINLSIENHKKNLESLNNGLPF